MKPRGGTVAACAALGGAQGRDAAGCSVGANARGTDGRAGAAQWWARARSPARQGSSPPRQHRAPRRRTDRSRHPLGSASPPNRKPLQPPCRRNWPAGARRPPQSRPAAIGGRNACRIAADWPCQHDAGAAAVADAEASHADDAPLLVVRGLIFSPVRDRPAEFATGERSLTDFRRAPAQPSAGRLEIRRRPGRSSLNFLLGRHAGGRLRRPRHRRLWAHARPPAMRLLHQQGAPWRSSDSGSEARRTCPDPAAAGIRWPTPSSAPTSNWSWARGAGARRRRQPIRRSGGEAVQRYAEQLDNAQLHGGRTRPSGWPQPAAVAMPTAQPAARMRPRLTTACTCRRGTGPAGLLRQPAPARPPMRCAPTGHHPRPAGREVPAEAERRGPVRAHPLCQVKAVGGAPARRPCAQRRALAKPHRPATVHGATGPSERSRDAGTGCELLPAAPPQPRARPAMARLRGSRSALPRAGRYHATR